MIETYVRPRIQFFFDSIAVQLRCTANAVTYSAFVFGVLSGFFVAITHLMLALVFLLLSGAGDVIDGSVARLTNNSKKSGAFIDLISDRLVEGAVIIGFSIAYPQHYFAYILFLVGVIFHFASFMAAGPLFQNTGDKSMYYIESIVARAEAFVVFAGMMVFPQFLAIQLYVFTGLVFIAGTQQFLHVPNHAQVLDNTEVFAAQKTPETLSDKIGTSDMNQKQVE